MGRFEYLVNSPSQIEKFRATYRIPQEVGLRYCSAEGLLLDREEGEVIIPIIAFLEGGNGHSHGSSHQKLSYRP